MSKPTLNLTDGVMILAILMVGLAVHQVVVAPRLAKK
jgi:hypothetical protein